MLLSGLLSSFLSPQVFYQSVILQPISVIVYDFWNAISGLYFHIGETERKCFIEEIPDETMVTGNYKVLLFLHSFYKVFLKTCMIFFAIGPALWPKDQWVCTFKSWDWNARWNQRSWWQNHSVKGEKNFQESKIYDFDLNFLRFTAVKANSLLLPTPLASMSSACTGSLHYMQRFCRN